VTEWQTISLVCKLSLMFLVMCLRYEKCLSRMDKQIPSGHTTFEEVCPKVVEVSKQYFLTANFRSERSQTFNATQSMLTENV
jgi:hypothetical protein